MPKRSPTRLFPVHPGSSVLQGSIFDMGLSLRVRLQINFVLLEDRLKQNLDSLQTNHS